MNYTANYHLPQWDETDRIMRTDFNQMCADMESGLLKTARDAAAATSAVSSSAAAAAKKAQDTANSALAKATAAFAPDNLPCVRGSFIGTGEAHDIELGFQPQFLVVWGTGGNTQSTPASYVILTGGASAGADWVVATQTGFRVGPNNGGTSSFNTRGSNNWYVAFR